MGRSFGLGHDGQKPRTLSTQGEGNDVTAPAWTWTPMLTFILVHHQVACAQGYTLPKGLTCLGDEKRNSSSRKFCNSIEFALDERYTALWLKLGEKDHIFLLTVA